MAENSPVCVNVRIEGKNASLFVGTVSTRGRIVTTASRVTGPADGTNGNEYPFQVPTCTAALADAAALNRFEWDGNFNVNLDDFFITSIHSERAGRNEFWQLALNFRRSNLGGGQMRIASGDSVLWALIPVSDTGSVPLRLKGPRSARANESFTVTVLNGETRGGVQGATVGGQTTNAHGQATLTYPAGTQRLQASHTGSYVRSNVLQVVVT